MGDICKHCGMEWAGVGVGVGADVFKYMWIKLGELKLHKFKVICVVLFFGTGVSQHKFYLFLHIVWVFIVGLSDHDQFKNAC